MAELAQLDGLIRGTGSKPAASMSNAVAQTEKIRDWVSTTFGEASLFNTYILIMHVYI